MVCPLGLDLAQHRRPEIRPRMEMLEDPDDELREELREDRHG
jgi:hypothetical protein